MRALNLPFGLLPLKCHSNSVWMTHYQLSFLLRNDITQISIKIETLEEAHKRTTNREFWENLHFHPEKPFFPQHSFLFLVLVFSKADFLSVVSAFLSLFKANDAGKLSLKMWKVGINFWRTTTRQRPKAACHNSPFAAQNLFKFKLVRRKGWGEGFSLLWVERESFVFAGGWSTATSKHQNVKNNNTKCVTHNRNRTRTRESFLEKCVMAWRALMMVKVVAVCVCVWVPESVVSGEVSNV